MKRSYHLINKKLKCVLFNSLLDRNATSALSNTHSNNADNNLADSSGGERGYMKYPVFHQCYCSNVVML